MKSMLPNSEVFLIEYTSARGGARMKATPTRKMQWILFIASLVVVDIVMTLLAFQLAYFVRFNLEIPLFQSQALESLPYYSNLSWLLVAVWVIIFAVIGLYNRQNLLGGTDEYALVGRATTLGVLTLIVFGFLTPAFIVARAWLLMAWVFSFFWVCIGRFSMRRIVYYLRQQGYFLSPTLIVGANDEGLLLARQFAGAKSSGLKIIGFIDKKYRPGKLLPGNLPVLGGAERLHDIIREHGVEEVVLASSSITSRDKMLEIFEKYGIANHVNVRISSGLYEIITTGLSVKEFASVPLVRVNKVRLTGVDRVLKMILDYAITIPVIILSSPILLAIAIAIKLDSPGPVIHRRRVMGVNGSQFDAFKFRTMYIDGNAILEAYPELKEKLAADGKLKDDPRITRVGTLLRKWSLDELPQMFNVLRHEMSWVGPRMISPAELEKYEQWYINLLTVRPGITGLWQVSGRSDVPYEERVRLDMHYIRNWSIWLDLQLLMRTIPAVLKRRGAY
jgi:exopolysaccharide biosynthesis polyprenyl glycosylphosphotransferase